MNAENILTVGVGYKPVRGGVAAVESVYSTFYKPFNHITTTVPDAGKTKKLMVLLKACATFLWWMAFHHEIRIVHVHTSSGSSFWRKRIFINLAKLSGRKVVFHCHSGKFNEFANQHMEKVSATINKCDYIVTLSNRWKQYFEQTFDNPHVTVIENVIPEPHINRQRHGKFTLAFLGAIGTNKGIYDLLDMISTHRNDFEGRMELLVGGNGEVEKLKDIIRDKRLDGMVTFLGWVSGSGKEHLLNRSDAYILPSYHEGVPISIVEAESYGLPVISTRVGGIPDIVRDGVNGFLITPGDKDALYDRIMRLMNDKEMTVQMGVRSMELAKSHLPDYVERQLTMMYRKLI